MTKEEFLALGLTDEQATKAATASGEELKGFIPKVRFDEVNTAKKTAEEALQERDKQLESLNKTAGNNEELKKQIETLQAENTAAKEKYEAEAQQMKIATALKISLAGKVHDPDLVAGLLDKSKIELDDTGAVKGGLDDQVKALKESKGFLFVPEDPNKGQHQFKGTKPADGSGGGSGSKPVTLADAVAAHYNK
ncbi:phage scaffolding protein [Paenibacillus chitinolyticus]